MAQPVMEAMDGNEASVYVAYGLSEHMCIYPITPSSSMAEKADVWSGANKVNALGIVPNVYQLESEAGASGSLHGCGAAGGLAATFTSSQGLLLMIPNLFKLPGERIPAVIHVGSRQVGTSATSIYCDHSDVMSIRTTGIALLSSATAQEAMDNAAAAHLAAIKASYPVLHFTDGFQTTHSLMSCTRIPYETLGKLIPHKELAEFRATALDPAHPHQRGTIISRMEWMQEAEVDQAHAQNFIPAVEEMWAKLSAETGRPAHKCFMYAGAPDATDVIVIMGCSGLTVEETVDALVQEGRKVGVLRVMLFRPWSESRFLEALPKTVRRVAVLDRTREPGAVGEPLFLDVCATVTASERAGQVEILRGRYGLGDKMLTAGMVASVYANLASETPKRRFIVGVHDDMHGLSLPIMPAPSVLLGAREGLRQATLWGLGSDGTVGACHMALRLLSVGAGLQVQGQFLYTAHKSGGVTMSHLRLGTQSVKAQYPVTVADYVACHHVSYVGRYPVLANARRGAIVLVNSNWQTPEDVPVVWRQELAAKELQLYAINASAVAGRLSGLALTAVFLSLGVGGVIAVEKAIHLLKDEAHKSFIKKGAEVVAKNHAAIDAAIKGVVRIPLPAEWASLPVHPAAAPLPAMGTDAAFVAEVKTALQRMTADDLPMSAMAKHAPGGRVPTGTTRQEKRGIAEVVPAWNTQKCVQCNFCSAACPHGVIRPFLLTPEEAAAAHLTEAETKKAQGPAGDKAGLLFRIQVSALDCTGCGVCTAVCPAKALDMRPAAEIVASEEARWLQLFENTQEVSAKRAAEHYTGDNIKSVMFRQPLFEFSGACAGCGETPYIKLLTQLLGERAVFACASGCNVAYSFPFGSNPYCMTPQGRGPATAHSLFEDTAEFGFGIAQTHLARREEYADKVARFVAKEGLAGELAVLQGKLRQWHETRLVPEQNEPLRAEIEPLLAQHKDESAELTALYNDREQLCKKAVWCIGGDGWASDIGYGGLDHVLSSRLPLKVLVLDTEVYSNTGGQQSKATPTGAIAKFAAAGKGNPKKDIAATFLATHSANLYVATVCLSANMAQCLRAFREAEAYPGPAMVVAYAPCIEHGIEGASQAAWVTEMKKAVDSAYWPLYRWDPTAQRLAYDGPQAIKVPLRDFLIKENRFARLEREKPARAKELFESLEKFVQDRFARLQRVVKTQQEADAAAKAAAEAAKQ